MTSDPSNEHENSEEQEKRRDDQSCPVSRAHDRNDRGKGVEAHTEPHAREHLMPLDGKAAEKADDESIATAHGRVLEWRASQFHVLLRQHVDRHRD